jgi:uncharacterized repeat protein (TIGR01451 family)
VTKFNVDGSSLVYSTYLGGSGSDTGAGIVVDSSDNAHVIGSTNSPNFPTVSPLPATNHGAFVAQLNAAGSALVYSTYLGGSGDDEGHGIAVDGSGNAYVVGWTGSTDFPTAEPFQATNHSTGGNPPNLWDAFVAKISTPALCTASLGCATADLSITNSAPTSAPRGFPLTYTIVVVNNGPDAASNVKIADTVPTGTTFNSVFISSGYCTAPSSSGTVTCTVSSLASGSTVTETLVVNVNATDAPLSTITDTATVSSALFDPTSADNSATARTTVM